MRELLPKGGGFLQDSSHQVHLTAAVAEAAEEMQVLQEEAAVQLDENLIHHKRSHDAQRAELLLCEQACVHPLQRVHNTRNQNLKHIFFIFLLGHV